MELNEDIQLLDEAPAEGIDVTLDKIICRGQPSFVFMFRRRRTPAAKNAMLPPNTLPDFYPDLWIATTRVQVVIGAPCI